MAAWRFEISPRGHVISSIYLPVNPPCTRPLRATRLSRCKFAARKERREVKNGEQERHQADFIFFKMTGRVMADNFHI